MFFERFRQSVARLPAGLIRTGPAGEAKAISAAESMLDAPLPDTFKSFLLSFDGVDLFHETIVLGGIGDAAPRLLLDLNPGSGGPELVFGEASGGNRFAFRADGRVLYIRLGSDERWIAGSDFSRWLDAIVAHERALYGPDGEFAADTFEPDGSEVVPRLALRQAEHALRFDPDAALWHHERGVALRRLGQAAKAKEAFARAAILDPDNPWPRFDLGRAALALGAAGAREALAAFEAAARLEPGVTGARFWIWGARAALEGTLPEQLLTCRREALARAPSLGDELTRARDAAIEDGDPDEIGEAEALLAACEGPLPARRTHLPILPVIPILRDGPSPKISDAPAAPARRTPPPGPRRPDPAKPRRSSGSRTGRRR